MQQLPDYYKQNDLVYCIATQCAPLICGVKISNLLIVENIEFDNISHIFENTSIVIHKLYMDESKSILLLYNYKEVESYLNEKSISQFMKAQGYNTLKIEDILYNISKRFKNFKDNKENKDNKDSKADKAEFPHELGIILGYPIWDVIGFIKNKGGNSLYTGYWKVYKNLEQANETFLKYEKAKETVVKNVRKGIPFYPTTLPNTLSAESFGISMGE